MEGDYFVLKGKLRDNDDATKAIALEDADSGHNTLQCGYNGTGDWVIIKLKEYNGKLTKDDGKELVTFTGVFQMQRDSLYSMINAKEKIMQKGDIGQEFYFDFNYTQMN